MRRYWRWGVVGLTVLLLALVVRMLDGHVRLVITTADLEAIASLAGSIAGILTAGVALRRSFQHGQEIKQAKRELQGIKQVLDKEGVTPPQA